MITSHFRTCNLCEAMCGLEIKIEDQQIISIQGDKQDSFSKGHICPKAVALKDVYEDANRLKFPMKRVGSNWQQISWNEAFSEVVARLKAIQAQHGNDAVGIYTGNPAVHNSGILLAGTGLRRVLNSKNNFTATSADQLPHHFAAWQLYGHPLMLPIPDIDHTNYMLILGGNPIASNGSIMTVPDVANRLRAIQQRGGKVVVIDPRRTETAQKASEHHFIRPATDAYLLLGMIHTLFAEDLVNLKHLEGFTDNIGDIRELSQKFSPETVATITGITAETIRSLSREFAQAQRAVAYGRVGVSVQALGGVSLWLVSVLNILTGNLDRKGGYMFTNPAINLMMGKKAGENFFDRWRSRVRHLPEFDREIPVATLADEILTEGTGQIKAMFTISGNPILSTPNGEQLDRAFEQLEFMVSVDIYLNETTRHAHIILPAATGLEVSHYDLIFHHLAVRNTAKYSTPLFEKAEGAKYDWEIFEELRLRLMNEEVTPEKIAASNPETKLDFLLKVGVYGKQGMSIKTLKENPHGIDLGELQACLPQSLLTAHQRINIAPECFVSDVQSRMIPALTAEKQPEKGLLLISRRHLRDNNSWLHNSQRLVKGPKRCTLQIHPSDAQSRGIGHGQTVQVRSRVGQVSIPAEITDGIMQGSVCMPHGYGHHRQGIRLDIASQHAGVSINDLTDDRQIDELIGTAAFSGVHVEVFV